MTDVVEPDASTSRSTGPPRPRPSSCTPGALRLAVRADLGGSVAGLWHGETPILRSSEPARLASAHESAMFPLVPYSNRLGYRRFRWRGKDYSTRANVDGSPHSLHGLGWQRPWDIVSSSALEVVLELRHAGDADWPFAFTARQYFALERRRRSAPACSSPTTPTSSSRSASAGTRTSSSGRGAGCTSSSRDRWDADATLLPTRKVAQHGIDSDLSHLDFDNCFEGWRGPARIRDERFSLQLSSSLPYLVVYTPPERDYFCVEPVSHVSNAIHMAEPAAHGLVALAPGATFDAWMRLDVAVL